MSIREKKMAAARIFSNAFQHIQKAVDTVSGPTIVTLLATLATALFCLDSFRTWYRLSHVPGPFWVGITRLWLLRHSLKGRQPHAIQRLNEQYGRFTITYHALLADVRFQGPLVRVGPNDVVSSDPEVIRRIMGARSVYVKGPCKLRRAGHTKRSE